PCGGIVLTPCTSVPRGSGAGWRQRARIARGTQGECRWHVGCLCGAGVVSHCESTGPPRCPDGLGVARSTYVRRQPEDTVLHQVVREHLETFLAEARLRGGGEGLPRFVERELREFLTCGVLAKGFARFRCTDCQREILVAFSCKGRGFCPSCCG